MRVLRLVFVILLVLAGVWLLHAGRLAALGRDVRLGIDAAMRETEAAADDLDLKLDTQALGDELRQTGRVVRRKARQVAHEVADATHDARTTAAIKARLALDPNLSVLEISVDTTDGRVTLAGSVDSLDDLARVIRIVLERHDVREVVSTIQVRGPAAKKVSIVR
jgi:hypothetical protein